MAFSALQHVTQCVEFVQQDAAAELLGGADDIGAALRLARTEQHRFFRERIATVKHEINLSRGELQGPQVFSDDHIVIVCSDLFSRRGLSDLGKVYGHGVDLLRQLERAYDTTLT